MPDRKRNHGPVAAVAGALSVLAVVVATVVLAGAGMPSMPGAHPAPDAGQAALLAHRAYTPPRFAPVRYVYRAAPRFTPPRFTPPRFVPPVVPPVVAMAGGFLGREEAQGADCVLRVPANPLSARGLATPYQLSNGPATTMCTMANAANLGAFVQATIIEPDGTVAVYNPLVITAGTVPAIMPPVPFIPRGSVVGIWTGFNGNILFLRGPGGGFFNTGMASGTPFGQVAAANAPEFFAVARFRAAVPPLGTALDGQPCPTTRDFSLVDQDPSDNVTAHYLLTPGGQTAENNPANAALLPGSVVVANGSDNNLLASFVDPALGCVPFEAPDLSSPGAMSSSQALNELQASRDQQAPIALVPPNDPMTTVGADDDIIAGDFPLAGNLSDFKTDLYRLNVGQPLLFGNPVPAAQQFCNGLVVTGTPRLALDAPFEQGVSPMAGMNLTQFLAQRLAASLVLANCALFNPGATPAVTPSVTPAVTPSVTPTDLPTITPSPTMTDSPTDTPTGTPTG